MVGNPVISFSVKLDTSKYNILNFPSHKIGGHFDIHLVYFKTETQYPCSVNA